MLTVTAIETVALLNRFAPLIILHGGNYLSAFNTEQLQGAAYASLQLYEFGFTTALVFFGFRCLSLGYLVFKSAFLPRNVRNSPGCTKLVGPNVTSAFELGSVDGFAPQQRIPDQLGIWLGVDHSLAGVTDTRRDGTNSKDLLSVKLGVSRLYAADTNSFDYFTNTGIFARGTRFPNSECAEA